MIRVFIVLSRDVSRLSAPFRRVAMTHSPTNEIGTLSLSTDNGNCGTRAIRQLLVSDRRGAMIRLQYRLRGLGVPIDVLVFSERQVAEWGDVRGPVLFPALREGIVLYEAA